ncbi:MAG: pyridoxal phosphate-dependent aminotransferase [Clostridia bacterium]|nr:pyridoxal phosphate-dependent aminotransferase [Clostridia bacterium]
MEISEKGKAITPSVTLEISAKAKAMKAAGERVYAFTAGEPDFNTPEFIIDSAKKAMDEGKTKYTATSGISELKRAIADKFARDNGLYYDEKNIVVSCGAKSSLFHAVTAIINQGDEVVLPAPYWITYLEQIKLAGGVAKIVNNSEKSGYKLIKEDLERAITPKTKCLILNSPCNPTGVVYTKEELSEIAEVCERHGITVISDEIYEKLVFDGYEHVSIASISDYMKENTIVINGVSKAFSMTGWRIGYLAAPEKAAKAIAALQGHTTSNPTTFAQYASVAALSDKNGENFTSEMVKVFDERRKALTSVLDAGGIKYVMPHGAFYVFCDVREHIGKSYKGKTITGSVSFADALLNEGVAVIPGAAFGAEGFIRLAYTLSREDIEKGAKKLCEFIKILKNN